MSTPISSPPEQSTVTFDQQAPLRPCKQCGYPTSRMARLINANGGILGSTLVCTRCTPPHRHRNHH